MKDHERMALEFLRRGPDCIKLIEDENTLAAAMLYAQLEKQGFVTIDNDDGMLVTITAAGEAAYEAEVGNAD